MTISPPSERLGVQRPRVLHVPRGAISSSGVEAVELAASAGLMLDPWQAFALDVALGERADGSWAAFEVGLVVSRQNGKGSILEARELAGLFLFGERLILHSAHEFKTAAEAFLRVKSLVDNTDDLRRKVKQIRTSHGDEGIELLSGARLRFVARSRGSGRGFSGDCVILDEAYNLGPQEMGALLPTLSARPNPQIWYTSSAPMETSTQLHAVRRRGINGDAGRLAYLEWSIDPETDEPSDPASWAKANPSLGIRISEEFISAEIDAMPAAEFARERLGVPDDEVGVAQSAIDPARWAELADVDSEVVGVPVGVVDVAPGGKSASIVFAGRRVDGVRHVELVANQAGTGWVSAERDRLSEVYGVGVWVRDPSGPAIELPGEWVDLSGAEWAAAATGFVAAASGEDVATSEQFRWCCPAKLERVVADALRGAVRRERGDGSLVWARRRSQVDITPLVAMTVGWWAAGAVRGDPVPTLW